MSQVTQVVYLADDGEWRFRDPELPEVDGFDMERQSVPCVWDPTVEAELSEWLPRPTKRFHYTKLIFPTGDWFPALEGEAQQLAGLKLIQAVVEQALAGLDPSPHETTPLPEFLEARFGHLPTLLQPQAYELPDDD